MTTLRAPTQKMGEERRRIKAIFPGWRAWQSPGSRSWNAYRDSEPPRFELASNGRQQLVSAHDEAALVVLIEQQVRIDIAEEFPSWRVRPGRSGDWYAYPVRTANGGCGTPVRAVHAPALWGLLASLRTLARRDALVP